MHGEYKVPGGKLLVIDFDVLQGALAHVQIAGDFFLEPDSALEQVNSALVGVSAQLDASAYAEIVRQALPERALLLGFSPDAVGTVIRRALTSAKNWKDYSWDILPAEPLSPQMNIALDEVLAYKVGQGLRNPTLRFWDWNESAVVLGSFQSVKNEVDLDNAKKYDVSLVRRISGGGAMFIEAGSAVTYSLYVPPELVEGMSFADSYAFLDEWALIALNALGVKAEYKPLNDIVSPTGKIGGAAQKRFDKAAVLHHVTMSYDMDAARMLEVLRIGREKISDKGITSAAKRVDPLRSQTGLERDKIIKHMGKTFQALYGGRYDQLTEEEKSQAQILVEQKFLTEEWTYRIP